MTDWESRWKEGDTPWDKGAPAPPLLEYLEAEGAAAFGGREHLAGPVLVAGCGGGHDVAALLAAGLPVVGLDLSPTAVKVARQAVSSPDADFLCGDLLAEAPAWAAGRRFGAAWEHTCFCAIDPAARPAYAAAMGRLLGAGGLLVGVFYLDPGVAEGPPFAATREEIVTLLAPWFELRKDWVPGQAYPGREGREWLAVFRRLPAETGELQREP